MQKHIPTTHHIITGLSQKPIAVYPIYIQITGSIPGGLVLSQIMYWWSVMQKKFYKTDAEIMRETLVSQDQLRTIKRKLKALGFIKITREGIPAKTYYEIDPDGLAQAVSYWSEQTTRCVENPQTGLPENPQTGLPENPQSITETTTETTQKEEQPTAVGENTVSTPQLNGCPYQKIIDLYHEKLPMLPRIRMLTDHRKASMRMRWKNEFPDLETWGIFFRDVSRSKFLTGQAQPTNGRKPFQADIDFLLKPGNIAKIAEGKYDG